MHESIYIDCPIINIEDCEKMTVTIKLLSKLNSGEESAKIDGWKDMDDAPNILGAI